MGLGTVTGRVADHVRSLVPRWRYQMTEKDSALAPHLRGNDSLLEALDGLIRERIVGRELKATPSDPVDCKVSMAQDKELRWVISRLEHIHASPMNPELSDDGEQPA